MVGHGRWKVKLTKKIDSIDAARRRVAEDPTHLGNLETLVRAQWNLADYSGVLDTLRRLLALNPFEPGYHYLRGATLQCLGHFGEARGAYERCALVPDSAMAEAALTAIAEIDRWPTEAVTRLAENDPKLRELLRKDPVAACRSLGFEAPGQQAPEVALAALGSQPTAEWRRPS
jgi:tetratricopeptide (TPR) repeat protein